MLFKNKLKDFISKCLQNSQENCFYVAGYESVSYQNSWKEDFYVTKEFHFSDSHGKF